LHWERARWKVYVDLYFILKDHFCIKRISQKTEALLKYAFIAKQIIAPLGYFKGINYDEEVTYLIPNPLSIKRFNNFDSCER
jgi:hypothetical protein